MFINVYYFASVKVSLSRFLFQINAEFLCTTLNVLEGETYQVLCFMSSSSLGMGWRELVLGRAFAESESGDLLRVPECIKRNF